MRRRDILRLTGLVPAATLLAWLSACTDDPASPIEEDGDGPRDLVVVETASGLVLVDANLGRIVAGPRPGVSAWDGTAAVTGATTGARTVLTITDAAGRQRGAEVSGPWQARVVSLTGDRVALTEPGPSSAYRPQGRSETTIVVVGPGGERRYTVDGCVEPEGFSDEGSHLFVLDYLPPTAPDRYRVRVLNLATGALEPLLTRDKSIVPAGAEEEMRGEGRQAVFVPRLRFLFTLYTHQPEHEHTRDLIAGRGATGEVHAFVHSLSVDQTYAFCIDLLEPFGYGPAEGHAITVGRNGMDPVVIDTTSGALAEIDGQGLMVRTTTGIGASTQEGPAAAAMGGLIYVGRGTNIRAVRPQGYGQVLDFDTPEQIRGLGLSVNERRLWVGQPGALLALDASTGAELARIPVDGVRSIGPVTAKR